MPIGHPAPEPYEFIGLMRECTKCGRHQPMENPHWDRDNTKTRVKWDPWCRKCKEENRKENLAKRDVA